VLWRYEVRGGEKTKVPFRPSSVKAKSNDPATWVDFESAVKAFERGGFDGVGFVFAKDGGIVGVDLDWKGWAGEGVPLEVQTIVDRLNSYTEWSPSRKGCHILLRGKLPAGIGKKEHLAPGVDLEVYDRVRFFTVTGERWEGYPADLEERQAELEALLAELFPPREKGKLKGVSQPVALDDSTLLERMFKSKHGGNIRRLWEGDISGYASHSEADFALAGHLMWWTGNDTSRADRLFRQSGLYRPKWDEKHHADGKTYGEGTLERARATDPYDPHKGGAGQKNPPADPREAHQQAVKILEGLTPETWPEQRGAFFEGLQSLDSVSQDLLLKKAASRLEVSLGAMQKALKEHGKGGEGAEPTAAGEAVRLALASGLSLWHTPEREPWGSFEVEGIVHHYPVRGRDFRTWLGGIYYGQKGKPLYAQALQDALATLEAQATFQGTQHPVFVRLAWHEGRIYFDLSRPDRQVVEIAPTGWRVIASADCPVRFRRTPHQLPLPLPEPGGSLEPLLQLLPLREARDRVVLLGWLVGVLNPWGGYPILLLQGSKGAGKSFVARVLKTLVDAGKAPLRSEPDNKLDLLVTAAGNHVLALDNLSAVSTKLSDLLCTLSTGGGAGKRTLYTDGDEFVLEAARPLILTGIALGPLRDDLADRVLTLNLERLEATARRPERELFGRFEQVRGDALGALFSAAAVALARWEEVSNSLSQLPRLGDWATWAEAAAPALGLQEGEIVEATFEVQGSLQRDLLDADPVARAVVALATALAAGERRKFTASELLEALEKAAGVEAPRKPEGWPKSPVGLAKHLPRLQDALREVGVLLQGRRDPHTKTLTWFLEKWGGPSTATTANTANSVQNDKKPAVDVAVDAVDVAVDAVDATTTPHQPPQRKTESWTAFAVDAVDAVDAPPHLSKEQEQEEEGGDWEVVL
jgi:hypothetical protein